MRPILHFCRSDYVKRILTLASALALAAGAQSGSTAEKMADIRLKVNGKEVAKGTVPVSAPLAFTANDYLDIGIGSPVSPD
jgi:hypothetical protein